MGLLSYIYRRIRLIACLPLSARRWALLQRQHRVMIDIGSPKRPGLTEWTTVDFSGADINWDLRVGLPIRDCSVDRLFSSHVLEHLQLNELKFLALEAHRVLKDGASFDIAVPDARKYVQAYLRGEFAQQRATWWRPDDYNSGSPIDQLNYVAYMSGEHSLMVDRVLLENVLVSAGFTVVEERDFQPDLDRADWRSISLYVRAWKSGESKDV